MKNSPFPESISLWEEAVYLVTMFDYLVVTEALEVSAALAV